MEPYEACLLLDSGSLLPKNTSETPTWGLVVNQRGQFEGFQGKARGGLEGPVSLEQLGVPPSPSKPPWTFELFPWRSPGSPGTASNHIKMSSAL